MKVYLAGPNAGKSGVWAGVLFQKGVAEVSDTDAGAILQLGRYHSAFPEKSPELIQALKQFGQEGFYVGNSLSENGSGAAGSGDSSEQSPPTTSASDDSGADASTGSGGAGSVSEGHGHPDSGVDISKVIQDACLRLDPENKSHWTGEGKPKITPLYAITKDPRITPESVQQHGLLRMKVKQLLEQKGK